MSTDKDEVTRKLRAILSADVKGYSLLMANDEAYTIKKLEAYRDSMSDLIRSHSGRVVDAVGDNLLAEFSSVVDAVRCSVEIQKDLQQKNADIPADKRLEFRIGVNIGDVIQEGDRIYGNGVNVAARIEGLAESGGICISRNAYSHVRDKLELGYEYLGEHSVKNIKRPVRVYKVLMDPEDAGKLIGDVPKPVAKRWFWATAVLAAIVITSVVWQVYQNMTEPEFEPAKVEEMAHELPDKPSIAVLPFDNMSGDPDQEFFSDGITEEIITTLSKSDKLFVIARNSTFVYKDKPVNIKQVAEELGVRYVLEGSVRKAENRVRITAQLIDATAGHHLWADRYDRDLKDIFALQDEITMNVVTALQIELTEGEQALVFAKHYKNIDILLKHLEARSLWAEGTEESHISFKRVAKEIIDIAPESGIGYRLMAWDYWRLGMMGKSPRESFGNAFNLAIKSLDIDGPDSMTYALLGSVYLGMRKYEEAIAAGERSISLDPNGAMAHGLLGMTLSYAGRPEEAIIQLNRSIRLNPFSPYWPFVRLGQSYLQKGRYEEALKANKKALQRAPDAILTHLHLAMNYALLDRQEEARVEAKKVLEENPNFTVKQILKVSPFKNKADLELFRVALRKAGFPENTPDKEPPEKPSIAVLPFDNLSDDPEQEYFGDGLAEEIITTLAKVPDLIVIARNSTFTYKGKPVKIQQVAEDLGVRYVLEGSVRKGQNEVRITAQLINASTGHHLWAERYDRSIEDIFEIQDEIALNILNAIEVKLTHGEQAHLRRRGTNNIQVYLKLLQGIHYDINLNPDDNKKAKKIYEDIILLEPDYAYAYLELAGAHLLDAWLGISKSPKESYQKAAGLAKKALSIDDSMGLAYALLGSILVQSKQWDRGIPLIYKGVELEPSSADSYWILGGALCFADRPEEAIPILEKAIKLNPIAPATYLNAMAIAYRMIGQYDKAIEFLEKATQRSPNYIFAHLNLSACYILADRTQEAHAEAEEVLRLNPNFSLDKFEKVLPLKNQEEKKRFIGALRKAFSVQK